MPHRSLNWNVSQFDARKGVAQHESAAAHVTSADELGRENQTFGKDFKKGLDVFAARDAAE